MAKDIHKAFADNWESLIGHLERKKREDAGLALRKMREALTNLSNRFDEYELSQNELFKCGGVDPYLTLGQEKLVDRLEAFHQQVYSALSSIILVCNFLGVKDKKNHPIRSVNHFLEFIIPNNDENRELNEIVKVLKDSISFRSKFVDHPQQNKLHNWLTLGYADEYFVIYFVSKGDEVYVPQNIYPRNPEYRPPVNCEEFTVNPNGAIVFKSVFDLAKYLFGFNFD